MMAVWVSSGALLLVILISASYSYPAKQGFDPSSTYGGSYGANPAATGFAPAATGFAPAATGFAPAASGFAPAASGFAPAASGFAPAASGFAPAASGFAPAASGSGSASKTISYPAQAAPRREPSYPQPSVQREPVPAYGSSSYSAPAHSRYASSAPAGSAPPSFFQPISKQDTPWAVAPPHPFSSEDPIRRPSARQVGLSKPAPEPLGPSNVSPPGPSPPEFQAGELSQFGRMYEHGNYESETEEQGFQPPPSVQALNGQDSPSKRQSSGPGRSSVGYPYSYLYDYMFLTGQYPPGTVTHSSSSFEQGTDHWQDTHYIRDYFPANPGVQQVETFPTDFEAPQKVQQPIQPVKQSIGEPSFGVETGHNQPYGAVGPQDPYFQPGGFEQPSYPSSAGGYRLSKGGH